MRSGYSFLFLCHFYQVLVLRLCWNHKMIATFYYGLKYFELYRNYLFLKGETELSCKTLSFWLFKNDRSSVIVIMSSMITSLFKFCPVL